MTTDELIRRAVVTTLERDKLLLAAIVPERTHSVTITVKPRGKAWRGSIQIETAEGEV
jgi:hypothetical protein